MPKFFNLFNIVSLLILVMYLSPYFLFGDNVAISVHDNMDANIVWQKILVESNELFGKGNGTIENILGGVPLSSLIPVYDISLLVFSLFSSFWAYVILKSLIVFSAYFGMIKLIGENIEGVQNEPLILYGTAICFACLPYWGFGLHIAYLPFLCAASINILEERSTWVDWLILGLSGFFTSLVLVGIFFLISLCLYGLLQFLLYARSLKNTVAIASVITLSYVTTHLNLFILQFGSEQLPSHRLEFVLSNWSLSKSFESLNTIFFYGQDHALSMHFLLVPIVFLGLYISIVKAGRGHKFLLCMEFLLLTSIVYGFLRYSGFGFILEPIMEKVPIQLQRFHFLHPLIWYFLLALSAWLIVKEYGWGKYAIAVFFMVQLSYEFSKFEDYSSVRRMKFKGFYAQELFESIREHIGKDQADYRVISISMHPSIALYNGFYTLDGYLATYPLQYKHNFKKIIQGELDKSRELEDYYQNWGSRAYSFVAEKKRSYFYPAYKSDEQGIDQLDYDWNKFKELGGEYVLSPFPINDPALLLDETFEHADSYWKIWLYTINDQL